MLRKLIALACAFGAVAASAQTVQSGFVRPPGNPAYVEQFNGYEDGSDVNTVGDGSTARGGTMPVLASQPADIPSTETGWVVTGSPGFVTVTDVNAEEAKARFLGDTSHFGFNDPVRNWGQPGTSHLHEYFGNVECNGYSTYPTLRNRAIARSAARKTATTVAGGPTNASCYWTPAIIVPNPFGDGKNYALPAADSTFYYVCDAAVECLSSQRIPRGLSMVGGTNMDDPYNTLVEAEIAAANAQAGTAGRYEFSPATGTVGNGNTGWRCVSSGGSTINYTVEGGGERYPAFKTAGGADPWGGNCVSGSSLVTTLLGPECYDGVNLWSPGGYKHFRRKLRDNVSSSIVEGCPKNWFRLPHLIFNKSFVHLGYADYGTWYLSSDASATARAQTINPAAPALRPGESMHFDYIPAWNDTTMLRWMNFCLGLDGSTPMHVCDPTTLDATHFFASNAPDGTRVPQVNISDAPTSASRSNMTQVPASLTGPHVTQAN